METSLEVEEEEVFELEWKWTRTEGRRGAGDALLSLDSILHCHLSLLFFHKVF